MTRDFIFDASGQVIGYRCRIYPLLDESATLSRPYPSQHECNRLFRSARGLWQHQRRAHGHHEQLWLYGKIPPNGQRPRRRKKEKMSDTLYENGTLTLGSFCGPEVTEGSRTRYQITRGNSYVAMSTSEAVAVALKILEVVSLRLQA